MNPGFVGRIGISVRKSERIAYYDRVDLVPGFYNLTVSLTNRITDDRAVAETRVSVPNVSADNVMLSDLLVASSATPVG